MNDSPNPPATEPTPAAAANPVHDEWREALKEIFDPEIPINIVDLGLIRNIADQEGKVNVDMTLTSPHCPVGDQLKARVSEVMMKQKGVSGCDVKLVFDPPWTKDSLTFEGKLQASMLGIM